MADNVEKIISVKFDAQQAINGLANLNGQIAENQTKLKEMANAGKKGTQAYAILEQQTKSLRKQKQDLSQAMQNEIKQQNMLDGSLRKMRAELSNLTKQYDALRREERENVDVGVKLKNQINKLTKELKKAEEGTERYYRNVGNYKNAILDTIGANTMFGSSLTNIVNIEGGFKGAMAAMGNSVKAFSASLGALLTNPVFLAVAGIAGAGVAFKWWYDYNDGLAEATRLTREFTGLTGKALSDLRDGIQATADTYGKDYMDVLRGVDTITAHWHTTQQEALDALNKGFASGADLSGNMLSLLTQYAPTLKDAGFSVEQVLALIQQTRSGIFSEQGLEAIKQASARLRNMTTSTKDSLRGIGIDADEMARKLATGQMDIGDAVKQVAHQLKTVGTNSQEAGAVMSDVFGRQGKFASQEMIKGLEDIEMNLDIVKQRTGEWGEDMDALREKDEQLNQAVADLFDVTGQGFEHTQAQAKLFVKDGLLRIVAGIQSVVKWMKNVWNSSKAVRLAFVALANVMHTAWLVSTAPMRVVIAGIKTIGDMVVALAKTFGGVKTAVRQSFGGLVDIFAGIKNLDPDQIKRGWDIALKGGLAAVKNFTTGVKDSFSTMYNNVKSYGAGIANSVVGAFNVTRGWADYTFDMSEGGGGFTSAALSAESAMEFLDDAYEKEKDKNKNKNNAGGNKRGGANKKGGSTPSGKSEAEAQAEKEANERKALAEKLLKQAQQLEQKAYEEEAKTSKEGIVEMFKQRNAALVAQYAGLGEMTEEEEKALHTLQKELLDEQKKMLDDFDAQQAKKREEREKKAAEFASKLLETSLDGSMEGTQGWANLRLQQIQMMQDAELEQYKQMLNNKIITQEQYEQMQAAIEAKYGQQRIETQKAVNQAEIDAQAAKYNAIGSIVGGVGELFGALGEEQKEFAILQKTLALGEIMISQAVAIANAIKAGSNALTPWQMIAQIAASVVAVTSAMAQAFAALDSAKFARGGYISGAGTSTSDSIPVRVSNGESVMNANTTAMFSGLLSSLNQLGGGVPIQAQRTASSVRGEDMLARAVAKGVAMLPAPVVSVQDINRGQRQVEVMNERATL